MFKKFGIGTLAVVLAVAFSAFTAEKKATAGKGYNPVYYWYAVDVPSQKILQNTPLLVQDEKQNVESPCSQDLQEKDCVRGFTTPQNTSAGDISARGNDQIMTEDPNAHR